MIPKAKGRTPPPTPWITRATTITDSDAASAASNEPIPSAASATTNSSFLPYMSPRRPMMGVNTDAERR